MNLDENQKQQVLKWLDAGLKLAEVQKKLEQEFGLRLTYMEVKFIVSDLNAKPKDPEPEKPAAPPTAAKPGGVGQPLSPAEAEELGLDDDPEGTGFPEDEPALPPAGGGVNVTVDQVTRPGAMISGKVTFANGKRSEWVLDQLGRLGVIPGEDGYKPGPAELRDFQVALQRELQQLGY